MVHAHHTVHLPLGALLIRCTMRKNTGLAAEGALTPSLAALAAQVSRLKELTTLILSSNALSSLPDEV